MSRLDELIAEWEAEVEAEAVAFMERDGMSPGEAGDRARALVNARRKQEAEDRKANAALTGLFG
jgi:hypothetical protein